MTYHRFTTSFFLPFQLGNRWKNWLRNASNFPECSLTHFIKEMHSVLPDHWCDRCEAKDYEISHTYRGEWCIFQDNFVQVSALREGVLARRQDTAQDVFQAVCATVAQAERGGVVHEKREENGCGDSHFHFFFSSPFFFFQQTFFTLFFVLFWRGL